MNASQSGLSCLQHYVLCLPKSKANGSNGTPNRRRPTSTGARQYHAHRLVPVKFSTNPVTCACVSTASLLSCCCWSRTRCAWAAMVLGEWSCPVLSSSNPMSCAWDSSKRCTVSANAAMRPSISSCRTVGSGSGSRKVVDVCTIGSQSGPGLLLDRFRTVGTGTGSGSGSGSGSESGSGWVPIG